MKNPDTRTQEVGERLIASRFLIAGALAGAIASTAAGVGVHTAEAADRSDPPIPSTGWKLEKAWDFDSGLPDSWYVREMVPYKDSHEYTLAQNVRVKDGKLILGAVRHCRPEGGDQLPSKKNETEGLCPDGKETFYSSARVETGLILAGDYRVEIKARLADMAIAGMRTAFWAKNTVSYCEDPKALNAEYDILELISAEPNVSTSTSHVVCDHGEFNSSYHRSIFDISWMEQWHTYAVEVVDHEITYFVDDEAVQVIGKDRYKDNKTSFPGVPNPKYYEATSLPQMMIFDTEVFSDKTAEYKAYLPPNEDNVFPEQIAEIESVRELIPQ